MPESIRFTFDLPVSPERAYRAWLDGYEYSQFIGSPARIEPQVGGSYSMHDGYIQGEFRSLTPYSRIVQSWRAGDFPSDAADSEVELTFEPTCLGVQISLHHSGIPDNQSARYLKHWEEKTFRPMLAYFEELVGDMAVDIEG